MAYDGYYVKNVPRGVPVIYDSDGIWCGLVARRPAPGRYQARDYTTGAPMCAELSLPEFQEWLASKQLTCPNVTR